jgi:hypothetical protein
MGRVYRTAAGKQIDMDQLILKNEDTIAIGNMRVNARGDELGPNGKVVKPRNQRVSETYNLTGMVPVDEPVATSAPGTKQKPNDEQ